MANESILIVEDEVAREGRPLEMLLKNAGYEVVGIAETEEEAVKMALHYRPDVVLMDIALLDARGKRDRFAGLRAAEQIRAVTGAQVIFVTGTLGEPHVLSEVLKTPDCQFMPKPVREADLVASIQVAEAKLKRKRPVTAPYVIRAKADHCRFDVFLSHNSKDKATAEKIARRLLSVRVS